MRVIHDVENEGEAVEVDDATAEVGKVVGIGGIGAIDASAGDGRRRSWADEIAVVNVDDAALHVATAVGGDLAHHRERRSGVTLDTGHAEDVIVVDGAGREIAGRLQTEGATRRSA